MQAIVQWVVSLPRIVRILGVALGALSLTAVLFPLVDNVYIQLIYNPSTIMLPSFVSVGGGLLLYVLGWRWLVGTVGEEITPNQTILWYLVVVMVAVILLLALVFQGLSMTDAIAG